MKIMYIINIKTNLQLWWNICFNRVLHVGIIIIQIICKYLHFLPPLTGPVNNSYSAKKILNMEVAWLDNGVARTALQLNDAASLFLTITVIMLLLKIQSI